MSDDLSRLAKDLESATKAMPRRAEKVVTKGVINIKKDWKAAVSGHPHAPQFPSSITDDITTGPGWVAGEVGPDKDLPQGALGNLFEFGSINNPPDAAGQRALDTEDAKFEHALEQLLDDLL